MCYIVLVYNMRLDEQTKQLANTRALIGNSLEYMLPAYKIIPHIRSLYHLISQVYLMKTKMPKEYLRVSLRQGSAVLCDTGF